MWCFCGQFVVKCVVNVVCGWQLLVGKGAPFLSTLFFAARDGAGLRWVGGVGFGWVDGEQTTATAQCGLGCGVEKRVFSAVRLTMRL